MQPVALIYPNMEGETFGVKYNEKQRWGYFKGMKPDEIVLIKWSVFVDHPLHLTLTKDTVVSTLFKTEASHGSHLTLHL